LAIEDIVQFFEKNSDHRSIPSIRKREWIDFIGLHEKNEIRLGLAEYIHRHNVPFPVKEITEQRMIRLFRRFRKTSMIPLYKSLPPEEVTEKFEYRYRYLDAPLGIIDTTHTFNDVSDYFQQENRMRCGSNNVSSPMNIWEDKDKLSNMNWHFWRDILEDFGISDMSFRTAFRLGSYTATQFKPAVAKALYERHGAINVLDTSSGWGDRLAGFYATPTTKLYVGCDPNEEVYETYKKQCIFYERILGETPIIKEYPDHFTCTGSKKVCIYRKPSEDVDWSIWSGTFDFYFTSPPYFSTEKYGEGTDKEKEQSWSRYSSFESWRDDFFFPVTELVWGTLRKSGHMMINIIEPSEKGKRLVLCDDMVDHFSKFTDAHYIGKLGMRMSGRPNTEDLGEVLIEPIWVFRKGTDQYDSLSSTTLSSFFV